MTTVITDDPLTYHYERYTPRNLNELLHNDELMAELAHRIKADPIFFGELNFHAREHLLSGDPRRLAQAMDTIFRMEHSIMMAGGWLPFYMQKHNIAPPEPDHDSGRRPAGRRPEKPKVDVRAQRELDALKEQAAKLLTEQDITWSGKIKDDLKSDSVARLRRGIAATGPYRQELEAEQERALEFLTNPVSFPEDIQEGLGSTNLNVLRRANDEAENHLATYGEDEITALELATGAITFPEDIQEGLESTDLVVRHRAIEQAKKYLAELEEWAAYAADPLAYAQALAQPLSKSLDLLRVKQPRGSELRIKLGKLVVAIDVVWNDAEKLMAVIPTAKAALAELEEQ